MNGLQHKEAMEQYKKLLLEGLQKLGPQSTAEQQLVEAAAQFMTTVFKRGHLTADGNVRFDPQECQPGQCPVCRSPFLDYGQEEPLVGDGYLETCWFCKVCGCTGVERERTLFDGQVVETLSDLGKQILFFDEQFPKGAADNLSEE